MVPTAGGRRHSLQWEFLTANKRIRRFDPSACVDLIRSADVFITDWTPDTLRLAGIDVEDFERFAPRTVVLTLSPFGRSGPYAEFQATDLILQALTGYMSANGLPGRPPLKAPASILEYGCGASAFVGVLAALKARNQSGRGQLVEVAAMEAMASFVQYLRPQYLGVSPSRDGGVGPPMLPCSDGHLFFDYTFPGTRTPLLLALNLDERDVPPGPAEAAAVLAGRTIEWKALSLFKAAAGLGATAGFVQGLDDLLSDEHLIARKFFRDVETSAGRLRFPGPPVLMIGTPAADPRPAGRFRGWPVRPNERARKGLDRRPLAGVRVLDLTQAWQGPYATMLLADLGADVVKIESPTRPDIWRIVSARVPRRARPGAHRWNTGFYFNSVSRNKRSLTLDLNHERGKALFLKLVETADLVMENYTPRVMDNFGLGYDVLSKVNPGIVMVSFSGYGRSGPYQHFRAHGASMETVAGWVSLFGYPDERPITMSDYQIDPLAGLQMAAGAIMGLLWKDATGAGQAIEGSMIENAVAYIGDEVLLASTKPGRTGQRANQHRQMAPHGVYPCSGNDEWVAIAVRDDLDWLALRSLVAEPAWSHHRFDKSAGRIVAAEEMDATLSSWTRQRSAREVMDELQRAGVPAGVVQTPVQALDDPHLAARSWFQTMTHSDMGADKYYGFPWSFSRATLAAEIPPPRLGEHSLEILRDELGLAAAEIQDLVDASTTGMVLGTSGSDEERMRNRGL